MMSRVACEEVRVEQRPIDCHRLAIPLASPLTLTIRPSAVALSATIAHVSNVATMAWIDRIAELHADHLGFSRSRLASEGVAWFVARHEVDFKAESWPGDDLVAATWVCDMRRVKSWRETVIYRPADDRVICRARTLWVLVDLSTRRPSRIPADMAAAFSPLESPR